VLEAAARAFPRDRSVSRDLAALIRRQEVARDSVQRCLDRARRLIEKGRHGEAVPWLQEVLINDPSRKDVARTIRDLRFQVVEGSQARRRRWRLAASSLVLSLLASLAVLHELRLRAEFQTLPEIRERSLASMRERLGALDEFTERHPIWHGTLLVLSERSALDVEIDRIEEAISMAQDLRGVEQTRRIEEANLLRERGRVRAEAGDYESALAELRRSLELATPDWRHRDRVEKDIQAIRQAQEKRP
jgi:tetratricopeptide (TPR) repeat protein